MSNRITPESHTHWTPWRRLFTALMGMVLALTSITPAAQPGEPTAPAQTVPAGRQASHVVVITIHGPIDDVTARSVERRIKQAETMSADAIVFEIDTWGGQATSALEICQTIKQSPIRNTVAWVRPKAISAGTFIALACKEIVIVPGGYMGDCAPILPGLIPIPAAERAKVESPLLSEVVNSARLNGYDERLAMAFVAVDIELWLVENTETGQRLFVNRDEYRLLFDAEPPESVRVSASGGLPDSDPAAATAPIPFLRDLYETENAAPGMTDEERDRLIELNQQSRSSRPVLSEADRGNFKLLETVIDSKTLLIAHDAESRRWGLTEATIANDEELKAYFGATNLSRINASWSEGLVQKLTSMPVRIALFIIFLVGLVWEMATPGLGVPIGIAIVAGLVLFGAPALTGMAQWWDLALIAVGIGFIAAEIFIVPGFGVAGVVGIACLGIGFIGTFVAPDPSGAVLPVSELARQAFFRGVMTLILGIFAGAVAMWFGVKHYENIPGLNRLVLASAQTSGDGVVAGVISAMGPTNKDGRPVVGDVGTVTSTLRPVGRARFGSRIHEVVSGRGIVDEGQQVRVTGWKGFETVVEAVDDRA